MMKKQTIHKWFLSLFVFVSALGPVSAVSGSSANGYVLRDISGSYAAEQISALYEAGIVAGDENGYFHPARSVTRAEFVAMLNRTLGISPLPDSITAYSDVPPSSWAYGDIQAASALGLVNGTSSGAFSPKRSISREEAATILVRALADGIPAARGTLSLRDAGRISSWARSSVSYAVQKGWMTGYQGYFRPGDRLTREETAVLFQRIYTSLKERKVSAKQLVSLGWQYQSSTAEYIEQVKKSGVNTLSPRWYFLEADGSVSNNTDSSLVKWAHDNGKEVWPMFGNRFDAKTTHAVLADSEKRKEIVKTIARFVDRYELDGINIDFEAISASDRDAFTQFIRELNEALDRYGAVVSVDVPPDTGTDWSEPYDYEALADSADYLIVMAYDQHWSGGPKAGSVSSLSWMTGVVDDLLQDVPARKLVVGLPLYTREWYSANGQLKSNDLNLPAARGIVARYKGSLWWDQSLGQYVSTYYKKGVKYSVWLEDGRSLGLKTRTSLERNVAGFAYWYLGSESSDVWTAIDNAITLKQAREHF